MSHRIQQVNELIKQELGKIFLREMEMGQEGLLTITQVVTSDDLANAEVLVSVYPAKMRNWVLEELGRKIGWLQHLLNKQLNMHPVPKIRFVMDERLEEADRMERLMQAAKTDANGSTSSPQA